MPKQNQKQKQSVIVNIHSTKPKTRTKRKGGSKRGSGGGSQQTMILPPPIYTTPIHNLAPQSFMEGRQIKIPTLAEQITKAEQPSQPKELNPWGAPRLDRVPTQNKPIDKTEPSSQQKPIEIIPFEPAKRSEPIKRSEPSKNPNLIAQLIERQKKMKPKTEEDVIQLEQQLKEKIPVGFQKETTQLKIPTIDPNEFQFKTPEKIKFEDIFKS